MVALHPCPDCGGEGLVERDRYFAGYAPTAVVTECGECDGKGLVEEAATNDVEAPHE